MNVLLTDEEMKALRPDVPACEQTVFECAACSGGCPIVAKAQLKKALQEAEDYIARDLEWANEENEMLWKNKLRIWRQALLEDGHNND